MNIQCIFSDLDETLLTKDHHVSQTNQAAIKRARAQGVKFVPTTGRGYQMTTTILKEIGTFDQSNEYVIAFNGAMIVECKDFKELYFNGLDYETTKRIYFEGLKYHVCILIFTTDDIYLFHPTADEIARKEKQKVHYTIIDDDDLSFLKDKRIAKIVFSKWNEMDFLHQVAQEMEPLINGQLEVGYSSNRYLEFNRLGVSKGKAIQILAKHLHVPISACMGIGDSENDRTMLETVGVSVAVENAVPSIKAICNIVSKTDYEHDAVAKIIDEYVLMD